MLGGNNSKLDFIVEKSFLEAVEAANVPREEIVCVDICDTHPSVFGAPGSNLRRDIQEHWNNIKRRKIRSYLNHIKKRFGVTPSLTTERLAATDATPSDAESDSETESKTPSVKPAAKSASSIKSRKGSAVKESTSFVFENSVFP